MEAQIFHKTMKAQKYNLQKNPLNKETKTLSRYYNSITNLKIQHKTMEAQKYNLQKNPLNKETKTLSRYYNSL
jgi:ribosomal protein L25 (general stress protein Ctc)